MWRVIRKWLNLKNRAGAFHSDYARRQWKEASESAKRLTFDSAAVTSSDTLDVRMFVGTWNVGGISPPEDLNLKDWLQTQDSPADVYVLGFQEIVPLNASNVLGAEDQSNAAKWLLLIRQALNSSAEDQDDSFDITDMETRIGFPDQVSADKQSEVTGKDSSSCSKSSCERSTRYCLAVSKQMTGIFLCLWIRTNLYWRISSLKVSCVGRGIMGYMGNKGSISISITLYQTSFCFVCTHLASGEKEGDEVRRNSDVMEILKKTRFSDTIKGLGQQSSPDQILQHDNIIWLGDLNYRLIHGRGDTFELLKKRDWQALLDKDQLLIEQKAGRVFEGWEEGKICFAPTYKYVINSDRYVAQIVQSKDKERNPAWCDRILWRGDGMTQLYYVSGESAFSDHRAVSSMFSIQINLLKGSRVIRSTKPA